MFRGLSLARKCQLLFGAAIVLIIAAALVVPWIRIGGVVDQGEIDICRQLARFWESRSPDTTDRRPFPPFFLPVEGHTTEEELRAGLPRVERIGLDRFENAASISPFVAGAIAKMTGGDIDKPAPNEASEAIWSGRNRVYRYARALRDEEGHLAGLILVERQSSKAAGQLLIDRVYLVVAGLLAGVFAVAVFYVITMRIILSPVRALRRTAERVREGDLSIRSEIDTGDEFEELADAFNAMLSSLAESQDALRAGNRSLDLRLTEVRRSNEALAEANRLKGEFLANVSHELRTPLNSIIGFAELLQEIASRDQSSSDPSPDAQAAVAKRRRYLENIITAGRGLLELINDLLEMARLEAGRVELRIEPMNVAETCDGLLALIRPQAERKGLRLSLELPQPAAPGAAPDLPTIETDPRKLQQIVFNFLSNAVKFTPEGGQVTLRAEQLTGADGRRRVRISVLDTGPGIAEADHAVIFDKFRQLESSHTRSQAGAGLGLAIAKELAAVLQGEIQLVSALGSGSMFSLIVPTRLDPAAGQAALTRLAHPLAEHDPQTRTAST